MANKPALCRADQSSSFGHLRPPPQTSVTTTLNCTSRHNPLHANTVLCGAQESCQIVPSYEALQRGARLLFRGRALDKALDTWYNTGVGLKKTHKTGAMNDND